MASSAIAATLTEAHRAGQAQIGAETAQLVLSAWPALDLTEINQTVDQWLALLRSIIELQRSKSSALAANYLTAFRALELGPTGFVPTLAEQAVVEQLITSMMVTGPVRYQTLIASGSQPQQAAQVAQVQNARSAMRHSLNGGRTTIIDNVHRDRHARGWARTVSGKPCAFCAMLASRGPVYKTAKTAHFQAHDGCHCGVEPVYSTDASWPTGTQHLHDLWQQSTKGLSGPAAQNAFRQALNA